ncbi:MAG TPA: VOC family protein [Thermoanaerobaculia bacterium]|jgi:catechol 2,3-dioxygenase-like lactoylglutathione lyase family enzyme|nr:VOC family protein [Thermoanaerobaculia bacterium]
MLSDKDVIVTIAVKDIDTAARFYEDKLGLKPTDESQPGMPVYKSGSGTIFLYPSQYAGTNQATAATFTVGNDLEAIVADLKSKGITFEHYPDLPDTKIEGDIHVAADTRVAWFKDPDGNIISLVNG